MNQSHADHGLAPKNPSTKPDQKTESLFDPPVSARDDMKLWRQARHARREWREQRYARLKG
jgi:hypothetical protein